MMNLKISSLNKNKKEQVVELDISKGEEQFIKDSIDFLISISTNRIKNENDTEE